MSDVKRTTDKINESTEGVQIIDYGTYGTLKILPIRKTLFNELDIEIYSKIPAPAPV